MRKRFLSQAAGLLFCLGAAILLSRSAGAQEMGSLPYYTESAKQPDHLQEWRVFLQYQLYREPCQRYQMPPEPYIMRGCEVSLGAGTPDKELLQTKETEVPAVPAVPMAAAVEKEPVSYTIYFGVDKAAITDAGRKVIEQTEHNIKTTGPTEVTVSGYASTTGTSEHNMALSKQRAEAVTRALSEAGVGMKMIEQKAYGETHLAVPTEDNVEMPANRRAVIEFNY